MRRNLWTMNLTVCAIITALFLWDPILPNVLRERGASEREIAWVFLLRNLGFWGFQLVGGWLADRWGRVPCIVWPTLGTAALFAVASQCHDIFWFVTCLVGANVMSSLQFPAFMALIGESASDESRGRAFGWFEMLANVGGAVGPFVGAWILLQGAGYSTLLALTAAAFLGCFFARLWGLTEPPTARTRFTLAGLQRRLTPSFWRLAFVIGLVHFVWGMTFLGPFIALDSENDRGMSYESINAMIGLCWFAAIPLCIVGGWLVDRFGARRVLALGLLGHAGLVLAWSLAPAPWALPVLLLAFAIGEGSIIGSELLTVEGVEAQWRGLLLGVIGLVTGICQGLAAPLGTWVRGRTTPETVYLVAVEVALFTGWLALGVRRHVALRALPVVEPPEGLVPEILQAGTEGPPAP